MPLIIGNVLSQKQVAEIDGELDKLVWEDGTKTAGATARKVKKNLQKMVILLKKNYLLMIILLLVI